MTMFFAGSAPVLFTILTVFGAVAAAGFLPVVAKKNNITKYISQTSIDVVVGILIAYAALGAISLLAAFMVWLGGLGPFGYGGSRW